MKKLIVLIAVAGMVWGCGKKSPTQAGSMESLEVALLKDVTLGGWEGWRIATIKLGFRFNSSTTSKVCLLDSFVVSCPNDSCPNQKFNLKVEYGKPSGPDTIKAGWASSWEGWIARSDFHDCIEAGAYPPGHGNYSAWAWGRWDGTSHQSAVYEWTW